MSTWNYTGHLPDSLNDMDRGEYLEPLEDIGQLEARELWVCSYCEYVAEGGEADEAGTVGAHMFFEKYAAPDYSIALTGEFRAGGDSEVTGVCDVCSSMDGLGQIELAHMA